MGNKTKVITNRSAADAAMARYAQGDATAFGAVYAALTPPLTRFFSRRLGDKSAVSDSVQETLLRVHRYRQTFNRESALMPWALTIAQHLLVDLFRRGGREVEHDPVLLDSLVDRSGPGGFPSGEEMVAAKQTAARLARAWARVSEPQRAALRLVRGEGLSVAEAAAKLGTTAMGVRLRTHRATRALQAGIAVGASATPVRRASGVRMLNQSLRPACIRRRSSPERALTFLAWREK